MRDVIVIGGGPAGTTSATLLARQGFSVTLLERERFPRFQIGESLLPYNNDLFERLGVTDQIESGESFPKYGAYFVTGDGQVGYSFRFDKRLRDPYRRSFQVKRARFDDLLLRNAQKHGVEVREQTPVTSVDLSDPNRAIVNGNLEARFVIDASGHGSVIGARVGQREEVQSLKKVAIFAHYRNVPRAEGRDAGNTVIVVLKDAWFWLIPITADVMSVGLVCDRDHVRSCGLDPQALLGRTIAASPWVADKMKDAERVTQIYTRKDFSFRMKNMVGPNYALVGDAAGFLDPIFSTGVFMAMKSADLASAAIVEKLHRGSMRELRRYEADMQHGLDRYLAFIEKFYDRAFLEVFLQPTERWGLLDAVVGVLAGDIFANRNNRLKLALFFALVKLQNWRGGIAPRIQWDALPAAANA
ncbi:MAG TPA: NAD(P)/FAD-dependent oxidoreductase [Thermoanaerobaculia bacterium]|nr:NAD(P)/FAD-dependent oxidoreductase [Thermoanaerobaculia bacterium]